MGTIYKGGRKKDKGLVIVVVESWSGNKNKEHVVNISVSSSCLKVTEGRKRERCFRGCYLRLLCNKSPFSLAPHTSPSLRKPLLQLCFHKSSTQVKLDPGW